MSNLCNNLRNSLIHWLPAVSAQLLYLMIRPTKIARRRAKSLIFDSFAKKISGWRMMGIALQLDTTGYAAICHGQKNAICCGHATGTFMLAIIVPYPFRYIQLLTTAIFGLTHMSRVPASHHIQEVRKKLRLLRFPKTGKNECQAIITESSTTTTIVTPPHSQRNLKIQENYQDVYSIHHIHHRKQQSERTSWI